MFFFGKLSTRIHAMAYDEETHPPAVAELDDPDSRPAQPRIRAQGRVPPLLYNFLDMSHDPLLILS